MRLTAQTFAKDVRFAFLFLAVYAEAKESLKIKKVRESH